MLISDVIQALQEILNSHGDLPVRYNDDGGDRVVQCVDVYDEHGNDPTDKAKATEAFIF